MPLTSRLLLDFDADYTSPLDLSTTENTLNFTRQINLASGTGANQADRIFHDTRTLTASATENLDLAGTLIDAFGATLTFARIKGLIVYAAPANTNNVLVGGAASNGFINWVGDTTDVLTVRPGGLICSFAPDAVAYAVTASTGDLLKVTNSGGTTGVTYDVVIVGSSA
jgi:hypothetical protein